MAQGFMAEKEASATEGKDVAGAGGKKAVGSV